MKEIFNYKGKEFKKVGYFGFSSVYEHGDDWIFVDEKGIVWHEGKKPKETIVASVKFPHGTKYFSNQPSKQKGGMK